MVVTQGLDRKHGSRCHGNVQPFQVCRSCTGAEKITTHIASDQVDVAVCVDEHRLDRENPRLLSGNLVESIVDLLVRHDLLVDRAEIDRRGLQVVRQCVTSDAGVGVDGKSVVLAHRHIKREGAVVPLAIAPDQD